VPSTEHEEIVNRASTVCGKSDAERAGRRTSPWWPASACPAGAGGAVETMEGRFATYNVNYVLALDPLRRHG
jgi:hypothetical protein